MKTKGAVPNISFGELPGARVAQNYQDGIFAGTNDIIETITGKPPLTVEEFAARNSAKLDLAA